MPKTYTKYDLQQADTLARSFMRATTLEQLKIKLRLLDISSYEEYQQGLPFFSQKIEACQPNVLSDSEPDDAAFSIADSCDVDPLTLLGYWWKAAIFSFGSDDPRGVILLRRAMETASKVGDDNILLSAALTSFGIATHLLFKSSPEVALLMLTKWNQAFVGEYGPCAQTHSEEALAISGALFEMLEFFYSINFALQFKREAESQALYALVQQDAASLDRVTFGRFEFIEWAEETMKLLRAKA